MPNKSILLDFGSLTLEAELFDSPIAESFANNLPYSIQLDHWGNECYGSIGIDPGTHKPIPEIPPGGLAYTNNGKYLCIFYGQTPAWPVEYIGQISGDHWKQLIGSNHLSSVTVQVKD